MKISSYSDKTGSFAAVNMGTIKNCYTESRTVGKKNTAGFVYENTGKIIYSVAKNNVTADGENCAEFVCRNRGEVASSGWIRKKKKQKKTTDEENKKFNKLDAETVIEPEEIVNLRERFKLDETWTIEKINEDLYDVFPTEAKRKDIEDDKADYIEISTADELFEITASVASGDPAAASGKYRLTDNINLHGKKWLPLGLSEETAFTGAFDGAGFKIFNFKIQSAKLDFSGFFGYVKGAKVENLTIDCVVDGKKGSVTGGMCGMSDKGSFENCKVIAKVSAEKCSGGFIGKNNGTVLNSQFIGKVSRAIPLIIILAPAIGAAVIVLTVGVGVTVSRFTDTPYNPSVIDPNQKPVVEESGKFDPPPAGSNRISFELNQEVYVDVNTQVGIIDYVNPSRSTQDVVISVRVSDAELSKVIGRTGRTEKELKKLKEDPNYDPEKSFQELYRSGRLQIGYKLEAMQLSKLSDGTYLPEGEYEMVVAIDAYNPETHEKAVVSAQAPITVKIVKSK